MNALPTPLVRRLRRMNYACTFEAADLIEAQDDRLTALMHELELWQQMYRDDVPHF